MVKIKVDNGYYYFKLKDLIKEKNISIYKLGMDTSTDYKVIKRMMTGDIMKLDIFVLKRLCDYFDCELTDIVEYKKIG